MALVVNAEGRGFQAPVDQVLDQLPLRSHQLLGRVVFKGLVRMAFLS